MIIGLTAQYLLLFYLFCLCRDCTILLSNKQSISRYIYYYKKLYIVDFPGGIQYAESIPKHGCPEISKL